MSGQLSLTEDFVDDNIPEYAILSHTLGAAAEEVTFGDLIGDTAKSKASYDKILFCGEKTRRDGLKYFWMDTNNTSLPRAINSIFRWYHNVTKTEGLQGKASWRGVI